MRITRGHTISLTVSTNPNTLFGFGTWQDAGGDEAHNWHRTA